MAKGSQEKWILRGRMVAVTSTGPIWAGSGEAVILRVPVGLALLQELGLRTLHPKARVSASMAQRVGGNEARLAWAHAAGCFMATPSRLGPRARLVFLHQVMRYTEAQRNVNGIEPVVAAAVNAAWPWLSGVALEDVLTRCARHFVGSEFAKREKMPLLDPNRRRLYLHKPGYLTNFDPADWLRQRPLPKGRGSRDIGSNLHYGVPGRRGFGLYGLGRAGFGGFGNSGFGDIGLGSLGGLGRDIFGEVGDNSPGSILGPGAPGGKRGPDLSAFGGPDLSGGDGFDLGAIFGPGSGDGPIGLDLSGSGGPDLSGDDEFGIDDIFGKFSGSAGLGSGLDLGNLGGNGGLSGFGAALGPGGAATPLDQEKSLAASEKQFGQTLMTVGTAMALWGGTQVIATGGASGVGWVMTIAGGAAIGYGYASFQEGKQREAAAELAKPGPAPAPDPAHPPTSPTPPASPTPAPAPTPKGDPKDPKHGDRYPAPGGNPDDDDGGDPTMMVDERFGGGRPKPNTMWDGDGDGGWDPTMIWDENGGGGRPNTIWDEDGDGGTPTTAGRIGRTIVTTGPGLLAGFALVGPNTLAF